LQLKLHAQAFGQCPLHQLALPGLIANALPEGWGLLPMDQLFHQLGLDVVKVSPAALGVHRRALYGRRDV
jgi:serine/threonine-protein kinase HipA